jgi:PadR family transcriptional regulator, regulatory protein PadR
MSERHLTDFELIIVLAILRLGEDAYGVSIAQEIEATGRRKVLIAAIYTALNRLETQGLVRSSQGEATAMRGGRAKRFFTATPKGVRAVRHSQRTFTALWSGVPALDDGGQA